MTFVPTLTNFLGALVVGFGLGLGWHTAGWLVNRTLGRL